jgi:hypothetical protein
MACATEAVREASDLTAKAIAALVALGAGASMGVREAVVQLSNAYSNLGIAAQDIEYSFDLEAPRESSGTL